MQFIMKNGSEEIMCIKKWMATRECKFVHTYNYEYDKMDS